MTLVVDCSVALKWVLDEEGRDAALALIGSERLIAPDFLKLECANVLATRARQGVISRANAVSGLREISERVGLSFYPTAPYVARSQELALDLRQTAYDCLYLALALMEEVGLVTADARFARAVGADPALAGVVRTL